MNKVKKYPVTKNGIDYTVKIQFDEKYICGSHWEEYDYYFVRIYKGEKTYPWKCVYADNIKKYYVVDGHVRWDQPRTPIKAIELAFDLYESELELKRRKRLEKEKEQLDWQELIDWDGNLDKTN